MSVKHDIVYIQGLRLLRTKKRLLIEDPRGFPAYSASLFSPKMGSPWKDVSQMKSVLKKEVLITIFKRQVVTFYYTLIIEMRRSNPVDFFLTQ